IVKIDVDGYETEVLEGMKEALQHKAFVGICIEVWGWMSSGEKEALLEPIISSGYRNLLSNDGENTYVDSLSGNQFFVPRSTR
ncbi:MAG: hypothetical protein AAF135_25930, partial [Bacteroidota bacterium]